MVRQPPKQAIPDPNFDSNGAYLGEINHQQLAKNTGSDQDDDVEIIRSATIPEGDYNLKYCWHETLQSHGGGKLKIVFEIADEEYCGTQIEAFYPVTLKGPPQRFGKFSVSDRQKYCEEMVRLFPSISRGDRASPKRLSDRKILCRIETVWSNWDGADRAEGTEYSKVAEMKGLTEELQTDSYMEEYEYDPLNS